MVRKQTYSVHDLKELLYGSGANGSRQTITGWIRKGLIKAHRLDPMKHRSKYIIEPEEFERIKYRHERGLPIFRDLKGKDQSTHEPNLENGAPISESFSFIDVPINYVVIDGTGDRDNVYLKENIITHYSPVPVALPPELLTIRDRIAREQDEKRRNGDPDYCWPGHMYALEKFLCTRTKNQELPLLELWYRQSDFYNFLTTNFDLDNRMVPNSQGEIVSLRKKYYSEPDYHHPKLFLTNTGAGINLSIITSDDYLIAVKRSDKVGIHKGALDTSVVEATIPRDADEYNRPDFYRTAVRGADEELGIKLDANRVVFLSFGVKTEDYHYALSGCARIDETLDEVRTLRSMRAAKDAWEAIELFPIDFSDPEGVISFLYNSGPESWGPNSLVCIIHTLIHEHSKTRVFHAIEKVKMEAKTIQPVHRSI